MSTEHSANSILLERGGVGHATAVCGDHREHDREVIVLTGHDDVEPVLIQLALFTVSKGSATPRGQHTEAWPALQLGCPCSVAAV